MLSVDITKNIGLKMKTDSKSGTSQAEKRFDILDSSSDGTSRKDRFIYKDDESNDIIDQSYYEAAQIIAKESKDLMD